MRGRIKLSLLALAVCGILTNVAITLPSLAAKSTALHFSASVTPAHAAIKALMEKEGGVTIDDKSLKLASIDLDADGTPEVFAFAVNTGYFCGSAGCVPELYRQVADGWQEIDLGMNEFINSQPGDWSVATAPQNGHLVLVLTETEFTTHFAWDGTAYSSID